MTPPGEPKPRDTGAWSSKPLCGMPKRQGDPPGQPCTRPAGWGTPHPGIGACKLHGGSSPTHIAKAEAEIARRNVAQLGLPREIEPQAALLEELHRSAGAVAYLDAVVTSLGLEGIAQTPAGDAGVNVYVRLWSEQRTIYREVARACVAAGIAEQRIQLEQDKARMVAVAANEGLDALGVTPEQRELFFRTMLTRMRLVEGTAMREIPAVDGRGVHDGTQRDEETEA